MKRIKVSGRNISEADPPYFIADIAANHDGNLERAFKLIELAKEAGADAAKFQNYQADKIVSKKGFENLPGQLSHQKSWNKPVFEVYQDASIPFEWTSKLKEKCDEVEIEYFTSPYDFESIDAVDPYLNIYKIGSGDITWIELIEYIANKGKVVILSTGASTMIDVIRAMNALQAINEDIILMQCNTNYTASSENIKFVNLNVLQTYKSRFPGVILGLSDHTRTLSTVLGAVALGARVFEKHFTDDNDRIGPDHKFAINPAEWREMIDRANEVFYSLGDGEKRVEDNEKDSVIIQRRSLRYLRNMSEDEIIQKEDLVPLRPITSNGIPPYELHKLLGRKLKSDIKADDCVKLEDIY